MPEEDGGEEREGDEEREREEDEATVERSGRDKSREKQTGQK